MVESGAQSVWLGRLDPLGHLGLGYLLQNLMAELSRTIGVSKPYYLRYAKRICLRPVSGWSREQLSGITMKLFKDYLKTITGIYEIRFNLINLLQAAKEIYLEFLRIDFYPIKHGIRHLVSAWYQLTGSVLFELDF
jgi:hypothetical protein